MSRKRESPGYPAVPQQSKTAVTGGKEKGVRGKEISRTPKPIIPLHQKALGNQSCDGGARSFSLMFAFARKSGSGLLDSIIPSYRPLPERDFSRSTFGVDVCRSDEFYAASLP